MIADYTCTLPHGFSRFPLMPNTTTLILSLSEFDFIPEGPLGVNKLHSERDRDLEVT